MIIATKNGKEIRHFHYRLIDIQSRASGWWPLALSCQTFKEQSTCKMFTRAKNGKTLQLTSIDIISFNVFSIFYSSWLHEYVQTRIFWIAKFIYLFIYSLIHSFILSFIYSFIHLSIHSFMHSLMVFSQKLFSYRIFSSNYCSIHKTYKTCMKLI